jgi:hypothetical protein
VRDLQKADKVMKQMAFWGNKTGIATCLKNAINILMV